jgi:hypothetical protein
MKYTLATVAAILMTPALGYAATPEIYVSLFDLGTQSASLNLGSGYISESNPWNVSGPFGSGASFVVNKEVVGGPGVGSLGAMDAHFEYVSSTPIAPGLVVVNNFNILDSSGLLSDTLSITLSGHTPGGGDLNNISVDLHFRSENGGGINLPALSGNPTSITEIAGSYQDVSAQIASSGVADLHVQFASAVPEPSTYGILAVAACLGFAGFRKYRQAK